ADVGTGRDHLAVAASRALHQRVHQALRMVAAPQLGIDPGVVPLEVVPVHAEMQLRDVLAAALHEEAVVVGLDPVFAHALILYRIITPPPTASRTRTMAAYVLAEIEIT